MTLEELVPGLKDVLPVINFKRIARLDICTCFHYVFKLASEHGLHTVLSANGVDELFCGYDVYRRQFSTNKSKMEDLMKNLVKTAKCDKKEIDKLSSIFNIEYLCPFLFEKFVDFSLKIPIHYKITSEKDCLRKRILRDVAS
jgi:asparagine synthase (glutamine-hydrolysing)